MFKTECGKCGGKGEIRQFAAIAGGVCFSCDGKGYSITKNAPRKSQKFPISAVARDTGKLTLVFHVNAQTANMAVKRAQVMLAKGNGYHPNTAQVAAS